MTHTAHVLHNLQRSLGFGGCPTDAAWPDHLQAYPCVPLVGVAVPGAPLDSRGALVGCSMPDAVFPYTLLDGAGDEVLAVLELPLGCPELVGSALPDVARCMAHAQNKRSVNLSRPTVGPTSRDVPAVAVVQRSVPSGNFECGRRTCSSRAV